jgi:choline dehydrogenase
MIYIRGNPLDFDGWGVPGWTWDDLFPYFLRSEDNERGANAYHAVGGELHVCEGRSRNPMMQGLIDAMVEAGLPRNDDFNGAAQDGAGAYQLTQRNGMRLSAAVAFLHPVMGRPNLHVEPYVQVDRILFEGDRAVGVVCRQLGRTWEVRAEREVLLCAGTYNSPQLLMLSGIGPAEHLTTREVASATTCRGRRGPDRPLHGLGRLHDGRAGVAARRPRAGGARGVRGLASRGR